MSSFSSDDNVSTKNLTDFLNQNQDVILIGLQGGNIVYQDRNFYEVDYRYAEETLLDLIQRPRNAPACRTEKGDKTQLQRAVEARSTRFPAGSLFRAVADRRVAMPFSYDLLICDDMGTECADFIVGSFEEKQLALVHAKVGTGVRISASAFHEVASQAMKNLVYLTRNTETPEGAASWRRNSYWRKTRVPRLLSIPQEEPTGRHLWDKIRSSIIASSNPQLYVVLLTAGCCDVPTLREAARRQERRTPEIAQLVHLLDGLNGYARQLGINVVIYDLPYEEE